MDIDEMIRSFYAQRDTRDPRQSDVPPEAEGVLPQPVMGLNTMDPLARLKAKLDAIVITPRPIDPKVLAKFQDLPDITPNFEVVKRDFKDDELLDKKGFCIFHVDLPTLAEMGRNILPMMASGFDTHGAIGLLILAYNLRMPQSGGEEMIYEPFSPVVGMADIYGDTVHNSQYSGRPPTHTYPATNNVPMEAMFYCYLASSALRLFAKFPENYIGAWTNIVSRFKGFYGDEPPMAIMPPTLESVRGLHSAFQDGRFRITLYKILYHVKSDTRADGMRKFLYDLHLANTGLHVLSIFVQLLAALNVDSKTFLTVMYTKMFERQINGLTDMARMLVNSNQEYSKKMWRFGRIFCESFMFPLQTKYCPKFVYIMASMLKLEQPGKHPNILQIVHFDKLSPEMKMKCTAVAETALARPWPRLSFAEGASDHIKEREV